MQRKMKWTMAFVTVLALVLSAVASDADARRRCRRRPCRRPAAPAPAPVPTPQPVIRVTGGPVTANSGEITTSVASVSETERGRLINKVVVSLVGASIPDSDDTTLRLIAPGGRSVVLMDDAGPDEPREVTIRLADEGAPIPSDELQSGTYRPTFYGAGLPQHPLLSDLNGAEAVGAWTLAIDNRAFPRVPLTIARWSLELTMA